MNVKGRDSCWNGWTNHMSFRKPWPGGTESTRKLQSHETEVQYCAGNWVNHWFLDG